MKLTCSCNIVKLEKIVRLIYDERLTQRDDINSYHIFCRSLLYECQVVSVQEEI